MPAVRVFASMSRIYAVDSSSLLNPRPLAVSQISILFMTPLDPMKVIPKIAPSDLLNASSLSSLDPDVIS